MAAKLPVGLRQPLGDAGALALVEYIDESGRMWREDLLTTERFERRLAQELGAFREEIRKELHDSLGALRQEIATSRVEILRWSFVFWIGQVAAVSAMIAFVLRR